MWQPLSSPNVPGVSPHPHARNLFAELVPVASLLTHLLGCCCVVASVLLTFPTNPRSNVPCVLSVPAPAPHAGTLTHRLWLLLRGGHRAAHPQRGRPRRGALGRIDAALGAITPAHGNRVITDACERGGAGWARKLGLEPWPLSCASSANPAASRCMCLPLGGEFQGQSGRLPD